MLPKHIPHFPNLSTHEFEKLTVRHLHERGGTPVAFVGIHHFVKMKSRRAGPFRIGKHMKPAYVKTLHKIERTPPFLGRFTSGTGNHVDTYKGIGHQRANFFHPGGKQSGVITAVHKLENTVASRLQRYVEMGHESPALPRYPFNNRVSDEIGLNGRDAESVYPLHFVESPEERFETLARIAAEVTYIYPCNYNFPATGTCRLPRLAHQSLYRAAARATPGIRDGAIGAVIVATVLHLKKKPGAVSSRTGGGKGIGRAEGSRLHPGLFVFLQGVKIIREMMFLFRAQHKVNSRNGSDFLRLQLGIATGHNHESIRIIAHYPAYEGTGLLVGNGGNGTCVDHTNVGLLSLSGLSDSRPAQKRTYCRRLGIVELAAQCVTGSLEIFCMICKKGSHKTGILLQIYYKNPKDEKILALTIDKRGTKILTLQKLSLKMKEEKEFKISYLAGHATTIISVTLVLLLAGIIALISIVARRETRTIKESVEISVIMNDDITDETAAEKLDSIRDFPFVKDPRLITRAQALEAWKQETGEDLEQVFGVNPLSPEIEFFIPEAYSNPDSIRMIVDRISRLNGVADVAPPDTEMVVAMNRNIESMTVVLGLIAIVMVVISYILINNTVRLTIYSRRFTIHTMQLVGATGAFISKPVVLNNMIAGIIAGLVASGIIAISLAAAPGYLGEDMGDFIKWGDFAWISATLVAGGALLCGLAAWIATRRYLRKDYSDLFK